MKTSLRSTHRLHAGILLAGCAVLLSGPVAASDRYCIPPPSSCRDEVVWDIHDFVHQLIGDIHRIASSGRDYYVAPRSSQRSRGKPYAQQRRHDDEYEISAADLEEEARLLREMDRARGLAPSTEESKKPAESGIHAPRTPPANSAPPPDTAAKPSAESKTKAPDASQVPYARPVPGKPGLVYPPDTEAKPENMVDVGDFKPGQVVRDPRTGKLFRVP